MKALVALATLVASVLLSPVPSSADPSSALHSSAAPSSLRVSSGAAKLSVGGEHGCRLPGDGSLLCWGRNSWGQLGVGALGTQTASEKRVTKGKPWTQVSAGGLTTCAIKKNKRAFCWGVNNKGQLGDGTTDTRKRPVQVKGNNRWASIEAGLFSTCGITTNTKLMCWGDNQAGQLARASSNPKTKPVRVPGRKWQSVSIGSRFICGIKTDGSLFCWGGNLNGQLGTGDYSGKTKPTRIASSTRFAKVSTSLTHTCALTTAGKVLCWGRGNSGQLGNGAAITNPAPQPVSTDRVAVDIATTEGASCLLDNAGKVACWGNNAYGILNTTAIPWSLTPTPVAEGLTEIDGGWRNVCGLNGAGKAVCWGENDRGQLGNGTYTSSPAGLEILDPPAADPAGATAFRLASVNALGNNHSRPYSDADNYAPATTRATWLVDGFDAVGADVVGLQETSADYINHIVKAGRGRWAVYPGPEADDHTTETAIMWRTNVWDAVETTTINTQFISKELPRPIVRLRHKVTGREIYVMSIHNAGWDMQFKRDKAVRAQIAKLNELRATGVPVFYVGDFNEKRTILCKATKDAGLVSPLGGGYNAATGSCANPPSRMRVDWIFGDPTATYSGFEYNRHPLLSLVTDHHAALVDVRLP